MTSVSVKISLLAFAALGGLALAAAPAQALPVFNPQASAQKAPQIEPAGWGCGPWGCRGGWGGGYRPSYGYYHPPRPYGYGYGWRPHPWGWRDRGWGY